MLIPAALADRPIAARKGYQRGNAGTDDGRGNGRRNHAGKRRLDGDDERHTNGGNATTYWDQ